MQSKIPSITIHGRFQTPVHVNHWAYISDAFNRAKHVTILITNPDLHEATVNEAVHRSAAENNPFTYSQRVQMLTSLLGNKGIEQSRYTFLPFDITKDNSFVRLDKEVPNLVNCYSDWSFKKAELFRSHGLRVIQTCKDKTVDVDGSQIRRLIFGNDSSLLNVDELIAAGVLPEAIEGLYEVMNASGR